MNPKNNPSENNLKTGGQILINALQVNNVNRVYCVPGESYLAALDAFHDAPEIQLIVCRQESGSVALTLRH